MSGREPAPQGDLNSQVQAAARYQQGAAAAVGQALHPGSQPQQLPPQQLAPSNPAARQAAPAPQARAAAPAAGAAAVPGATAAVAAQQAQAQAQLALRAQQQAQLAQQAQQQRAVQQQAAQYQQPASAPPQQAPQRQPAPARYTGPVELLVARYLVQKFASGGSSADAKRLADELVKEGERQVFSVITKPDYSAEQMTDNLVFSLLYEKNKVISNPQLYVDQYECLRDWVHGCLDVFKARGRPRCCLSQPLRKRCRVHGW